MVWAKAEAVNTSKIADYLLFAAAEYENRDFILVVMENTWVRELREPVMFSTDTAQSKLLDHLQTLCGGLQTLDILSLQT